MPQTWFGGFKEAVMWRWLGAKAAHTPVFREEGDTCVLSDFLGFCSLLQPPAALAGWCLVEECNVIQYHIFLILRISWQARDVPGVFLLLLGGSALLPGRARPVLEVGVRPAQGLRASVLS